MRFKLLSLAAMLALTACASTPEFTPGSHLSLYDANELPPPANVDTNGAYIYRVGALDKLAIAVFGIPELTQVAQVSGGGRISFPFIGEIQAQGRTPEELAREIEAGLRRNHIRNPQVTVNLEETVSQVVTVDGQVREPGLYPVMGEMSLMRIVARARGTTEYARLQDVVVFRTVGDQQMAALYNLEAIRRGMYPDPSIYPNDVVVVGDSPARRMFREAIQAGGLIMTPIVAVLQRI
jgi:polysaccharide biosynthesis/export protein